MIARFDLLLGWRLCACKCLLSTLIQQLQTMIGPDIPAHLLGNTAPSEDEEEPEAGPSQPASIGPAIPPDLLAKKPAPTPVEEEDDDEDDYMPALPPDLGREQSNPANQPLKKVLGPSFPPVIGSRGGYYNDEDDEDVGPQPLPSWYVPEEKDGVTEFLEKEERRRKQVEVSSALAYSWTCFEIDKFV